MPEGLAQGNDSIAIGVIERVIEVDKQVLIFTV